MNIAGSYMPLDILALITLLPLGVTLLVSVLVTFAANGRPMFDTTDDPNRPEVSVSAAA